MAVVLRNEPDLAVALVESLTVSSPLTTVTSMLLKDANLRDVRATCSSPAARWPHVAGALVYIRDRERIARAASSFGILREDAVTDESENVPVSGVLRTHGKRRVF